MGDLIASLRLLGEIPWRHRPAAVIVAIAYHVAMKIKRLCNAQD